MKNIIKMILLFSVAINYGQLKPLLQFKLNDANRADANESPGLRTNSINSIVSMGEQTTWIGTGIGLSVMHDSTSIFSLDTMFIVDEQPRILNNSVLSMTVQDSVLAFSTWTIDENGILEGTGIYLSDNGLTDRIEWTMFKQPVDGESDSLIAFGPGYFNAYPSPVAKQNISRSININDDYLWIASWTGGLRRMDLRYLKKWELVPLPLDNLEMLETCDLEQYELINDKFVLRDFYFDYRDPDIGNHNHKGFSVLAYGDTVWVGTANGINRGILGENDCVDWQHYFHPNDNISGNLVLKIASQEINGQRIIWAITRVIVPGEEQNSVSFTRDDGDTWEIVEDLIGETCNDISVNGSTVVIASDNGLWKTENGKDWELIPPAIEATPVSFDEILTNRVETVLIDSREYFDTPIIWIGTNDGLARSYNTVADNWQIYRKKFDESEIYAYPNPFSPLSDNQLNNDGWVRFNTGNFSIGQVDLDIYNFAFEKVYSERFDWQTSPGAIKWNGRDENNNLVANGVYFINVRFSEDGNSNKEDHWLKLVVVK